MDPSLILFFEIVLIISTALVMLVGLVGAVIPVLPGSWLIWLAALGYGVAQWLLGQTPFDGWVGSVAMVILTLLALVDLGLEYVITHYVTHQEGVSFKATLASIGLGLVGIFFFPPIGPLVGSMLGLFLVEYFRHERDWRKALKGLRSYAKGCGWAMLAEVTLCLVMIGVWVIWVIVAFMVG